MPQIDIYGHSDDLIEVEGDVSEEFYANYGEPTILEMTNGYVIEVEYDGEWTFEVIGEPKPSNYELVPVGASDEYNDYSEILRINDPTIDRLGIEKR